MFEVLCHVVRPREKHKYIYFCLFPPAIQGEKKSFSIGTWNARSLFCRDYVKLKLKIKLLQKTSASLTCSVFKDAEVVKSKKTIRGNRILVHKHLRLLSRDFWIEASLMEGNAGGVITFGTLTVSLDRGQTQAIIQSVEAVVGQCAANPLHNNIPVSWDVNIMFHSIQLFAYSTPNICSGFDIAVLSCPSWELRPPEAAGPVY